MEITDPLSLLILALIPLSIGILFWLVPELIFMNIFYYSKFKKEEVITTTPFFKIRLKNKDVGYLGKLIGKFFILLSALTVFYAIANALNTGIELTKNLIGITALIGILFFAAKSIQLIYKRRKTS